MLEHIICVVIHCGDDSYKDTVRRILGKVRQIAEEPSREEVRNLLQEDQMLE